MEHNLVGCRERWQSPVRRGKRRAPCVVTRIRVTRMIIWTGIHRICAGRDCLFLADKYGCDPDAAQAAALASIDGLRTAVSTLVGYAIVWALLRVWLVGRERRGLPWPEVVLTI